MNNRRVLIIIKGENKTDSVDSVIWNPSTNTYDIIFKNDTDKTYSYSRNNVRILKDSYRIDPQKYIYKKDGCSILGISAINDYGDWIEFVREGYKTLVYQKSELTIETNCLAQPQAKHLMEYYKNVSSAVSLVTENGQNILEIQYSKVSSVSDDTVLASYFGKKQSSLTIDPDSDTIIYPFGINQSQKKAVENAFSSQISIIQGPPGTGKTQTILNIIANAIIRRKTIAVVSNNNAATANVFDKLNHNGLSFIAALLGSLEKKQKFLEEQKSCYPDMRTWRLDSESAKKLNDSITKLEQELTEMHRVKNRIAAIKEEMLNLTSEQHYFDDYCKNAHYSKPSGSNKHKLSSYKLMDLLLLCERLSDKNKTLGLFGRLIVFFRYGRYGIHITSRPIIESAITLQKEFYKKRKKELIEEQIRLEKKLKNYNFDDKMSLLTRQSMSIFRAYLARRYNGGGDRQTFSKDDFRRRSQELNQEYPLVLSTTYSIRGTLGFDYNYDYLIVDEASQVDLATAILAFSCARNIVIVGDQNQLPNVITAEKKETTDKIWSRYNFPDKYNFSIHSMLSSAKSVWKNMPQVLLREHYRCHPKIAGFFNQKFYGGQLIIHTTDNNEPNVVAMYKTLPGNHARDHYNQRQIDIIKDDVIPTLRKCGCKEIGIISPYRHQVEELQRQLGKTFDIDTVHKFQGREKDAIVLSTVDNAITDFVDDPHMLNVAVSRAKKMLCVVISDNEDNEHTNYGDLVKYIEYNNFKIYNSKVFSILDLLYRVYADQRRAFLKRHKQISQYASENIMFALIEKVLNQDEFSKLGCTIHTPVYSIVRDYSALTERETQFAQNPWTHTDFLIYNKMNKMPLLAIEVDGCHFHAKDSTQADRDALKDTIFAKCNIPLIRFRTNESNEEQRLLDVLTGLTGNKYAEASPI